MLNPQNEPLFSSYDSDTYGGRLSRWWKHNVTEYFSPLESQFFVKATNPHDTLSQRPTVWANPHDMSSQGTSASELTWDPRKLFANFVSAFAEPETPLYFNVLKNPEFAEYCAWRAQINLENEFAERVFCQDLIWQVIQFGAKVIKKKDLLKFFSNYENIVDESLFKEIKNIISKFQDEANAYFKNHADKETGTLFVTLPNHMVRGVIGEINASFDRYERELSVEEIDENEVEEKTFYQAAKESLQAGYHVLRKHPWKVIGAIATTAAIIYAGKRSDSTNFNPLTMPQFPQWATPSWQMTNALTQATIAYGLSMTSVGREYAVPGAFAAMMFSMVQTVKADLNTDLLVYLPLFKGNANDESGNGYNGTAYNGAHPLVDRFGKPCCGYYFDGVNDYIRIGAMGATPAQGTISFWMYPISIDNWGNPFSTYIFGESTAIRLQEYSNKNYVAVVGSSAAAFTFHPYGNINLNEWINTVLTWDKNSGNVKGWLNSGLKFNQTTTTFPSQFLDVGLGAGYSSLFKGILAELRIYNRTLTAAEIDQLYHTSSSSSTTSTSSTSTETSTSSASTSTSTSSSSSTTMPTRSRTFILASSSSFFGSSNTLSTRGRSSSSSPMVSEDSRLGLGWILLMIGEPIIAAIIFVPLFMIGMKCWRNKANAAHNGDSLELSAVPSTLPGTAGSRSMQSSLLFPSLQSTQNTEYQKTPNGILGGEPVDEIEEHYQKTPNSVLGGKPVNDVDEARESQETSLSLEQSEYGKPITSSSFSTTPSQYGKAPI